LTAADGGYLFPKFIGEVKLGELLETPKKIGQSAAKLLSKWQMKVQRLGLETTNCGI